MTLGNMQLDLIGLLIIVVVYKIASVVNNNIDSRVDTVQRILDHKMEIHTLAYPPTDRTSEGDELAPDMHMLIVANQALVSQEIGKSIHDSLDISGYSSTIMYSDQRSDQEIVKVYRIMGNNIVVEEALSVSELVMKTARDAGA